MLSDFAKEKVFWTRKMNLRLVKFIESRSNIWNPKHPKYTSVEYRDRTYSEFAAKYGNEFTGQAVKDRWTNIRSTFANYLRKIRASQGKGTEEYQVNWHLWNSCQFLLKVNRAIKPGSEDIQQENKEEILISEENTCSEDYISDSNSTRTTNVSCRALADNLVTVFKGLQNDAFGLDNTRNGRIGRIVTKKLNQMNSFEAAQISKKIMEILCQYDPDNPLNTNNFKTESF